jgi:hypothetical protein
MGTVFSYFGGEFDKAGSSFKSNIGSILMITWFIILIVIYLVVFDLSFKDEKKKKTTKIFIEEMKNMKERFEIKQKNDIKTLKNVDYDWYKNTRKQIS